MKKSRIISFMLLIGITVFLLCSTVLDFNNDSVEATLVKSFGNSGAKVISAETYFTGLVAGNKKGFAEQKLFIENLAEQIGVLKNEAYLFTQINNDSIQKIEVSGITKENRSVDINLQLNGVSKGNENVITVAIMQYESVLGLEDIKKKLSVILKRYKIHPKVNSCITGSLVGKYENSQIDEICENILKSAEAKKLNTTKDRNLISVSAYSHNLGSTLNVSGKKMNLNLAIRYNSLEDKTYIWLATPVITTEF